MIVVGGRIGLDRIGCNGIGCNSGAVVSGRLAAEPPALALGLVAGSSVGTLLRRRALLVVLGEGPVCVEVVVDDVRESAGAGGRRRIEFDDVDVVGFDEPHTVVGVVIANDRNDSGDGIGVLVIVRLSPVARAA